MSLKNQHSHFLLIILIFTLFNFDSNGMSLPKTHLTLVEDLESGRAEGSAAELAAGGLTCKEVATPSDAQHTEDIVKHDTGSESEEKEPELKDAIQLFDKHRYEAYNSALESDTTRPDILKYLYERFDEGREPEKHEYETCKLPLESDTTRPEILKYLTEQFDAIEGRELQKHEYETYKLPLESHTTRAKTFKDLTGNKLDVGRELNNKEHQDSYKCYHPRRADSF